MEQLVGQWLGNGTQHRYQLSALLGKQTGRRTYLASDAHSSQSVVIKLILFGPDFAWSELRLFEREAETLKSLRHGAIPAYLDYFEVDTDIGKGFALVQTHIDARSLQAQLEAGRSFSEDALKAIARQLLDILIYLHSQHPPVIHRDIKPSNILLTDAHKPMQLYLVDFGAVQTIPTQGTMTIVGTYGYMPIEQFSGRALPASDLYSLGATLVYLATGKHPAEMVQPDLQLNFEPYTHFTSAFTQWLKQLTCANLSRRISSAQAAVSALSQRSGQRGSQLANSSLPLFSTANSKQNISEPIPIFKTSQSDAAQNSKTTNSKTVTQRNKSPLPLFPSSKAPLTIKEPSSTYSLSRRDTDITLSNERISIDLLKSRILNRWEQALAYIYRWLT